MKRSPFLLVCSILLFAALYNTALINCSLAASVSSCGPSGGTGGANFNDGMMAGYKISEVIIRTGAYIDAIQIVYVLDNTIGPPW